MRNPEITEKTSTPTKPPGSHCRFRWKMKNRKHRYRPKPITSILLREYEHNSFSLWKFYQRRIARLFPAFFTVALVTLLGAFFIYSAQDLASCGATLASAALSVVNFKYMLQGSY